MSGYFKDSEFDCKCGCGLGLGDMNESSVMRLKLARGVSNTPYNLNSAIRCKKHNKSVGSKKTSSHPKGYAFDIRATTYRIRWKVLKGLMEAGFNRIGIGIDFIHADDDPDKPPAVIWLY